MGTRISGRVAQIDSYPYLDCNKIADVSCTDYSIIGTDWFVPTYLRSGGVGYKIQKSSTKPSATSVKAVRVRDNNAIKTVWFLINDNADESVITNNCNACCDSVTPLPAVVVPTPVIESPACEVVPDPAASTFEKFAVASPLTAGQKYYPYLVKDGVIFTPAPGTTGYASVAAVQTWVAANWSSAGTWTADGQKLTLSATNAFYANLEVYAITQLAANAGNAQTVTGTTATVSGTTSVGAVSYAWARTGGTGDGTGVVIASPNSVTTNVSGLTAGTHIFTLTAKNKAGATSTATVTVTKS